jgi:hypothetical protein
LQAGPRKVFLLQIGPYFAQNTLETVGALQCGHWGGWPARLAGIPAVRWAWPAGDRRRVARGSPRLDSRAYSSGGGADGPARWSQAAAAAGSSAPARRRLGGKSERVGELQQMPEEVGDALVGQCGGPALVLVAAASDGGARTGHKELWRLSMRGIGGGSRFIVDACLPVTGGPTAAFSG